MIPLELLKQENFDLIEWIKVVKSLECKNFNVLFGDLNQKCPKVYVFSSVSSELESVSFDDSKIFSLSNGSASSNWDKQQKGKEMIQNYIDSNVFTESSLFSVLT